MLVDRKSGVYHAVHTTAIFICRTLVLESPHDEFRRGHMGPRRRFSSGLVRVARGARQPVPRADRHRGTAEHLI